MKLTKEIEEFISLTITEHMGKVKETVRVMGYTRERMSISGFSLFVKNMARTAGLSCMEIHLERLQH